MLAERVSACGEFIAATADAYTGGTVLGTVPFASLTGTDPTQVATLTNVSNTLTAGTYQVCAILNSTTGFPALCRPQVCQTMVVNANPSITAFSNSPACVGEDNKAERVVVFAEGCACSGVKLGAVIFSGVA